MVALAGFLRVAREPSSPARPADEPSSRRERTLRAAAVLGLTLVAAGLRLWRLDSIPPGFHGDEALTGLEAVRILHEGWIGPWATSTLGWPAGHLYWTAAVVGIFGPSVTSVRLALALWGIAAVPVAYVVFRSLFGWRVGIVAAALLAVSVWSIHLSRTGFSSPPWPVFELAAIGLLFSSMRGRPLLFMPLGAVAGLGVYFYILIPWSLALLAVFTVAWWLVDPAVRTRTNALGLLGAGAVMLVVATPMIHYAMSHGDAFLGKYHRDARRSVLLRKPHETESGTRLRAAALAVAGYGRGLFLGGHPDGVDGMGVTPPIEAATAVLFAFGVVLAFRARHDPAFALLLFLFVMIPLPAALDTQGRYRGSFGLVPVIAALAALPVARLWEEASRAGRPFRFAGYALIGCCGALIAAWNVHTYFDTFARSPDARWVYAADFRSAVEYAKRLRPTPKIYFLSRRWSWNYSPRRFLAPDLAGENRSREFGTFSVEHAGTSPAVFLLLDVYREIVPELRRRYPTGRIEPSYASRLKTPFVAYRVPP